VITVQAFSQNQYKINLTYDSVHAGVDVAACVDVQKRPGAEGHLHITGLEATETIHRGRLKQIS